MILIFDLFQTLVEDIHMDFNLGLKPLWETYYRDKCSFDEIKAYGEELFVHMQDLHKKGLEFPFVNDNGYRVYPAEIRSEMRDLVRNRLKEVTCERKIYCDSDGGIFGDR